MPISVEKTVVLHCGSHQPENVYTLNGQAIVSVNSHKDLGIVVSTDSTFSKQCESVVSKAARAAYAIQRVFRRDIGSSCGLHFSHTSYLFCHIVHSMEP
jgi:hypothetical protein